MSTNPHSTTTSTGAPVNSKTNSVLSDIKDGIKGIHGVGESLRGNFNGAVDRAFNEPTGEAKNRYIADKGEAEINRADDMIARHEHGNAHATRTNPVPTTGNVHTAPTSTHATGHATTGPAGTGLNDTNTRPLV